MSIIIAGCENIGTSVRSGSCAQMTGWSRRFPDPYGTFSCGDVFAFAVFWKIDVAISPSPSFFLMYQKTMCSASFGMSSPNFANLFVSATYVFPAFSPGNRVLSS